MPTPKTHFVVYRRNWHPMRYSAVFVLLPGEIREASFATESLALDDARQREADARKRVNPFLCGTTWADRSHLPEGVFSDYLRDAGIEPPDTDGWANWWKESGETLSQAQREHVWQGLDRLRFYEVREQPIRPVVFAVVAIQWNYNDEWYYPGSEGGHVHAAYRSRQRAERERDRLELEARQRWRTDLDLPAPGEFAQGGEIYHLFPFDMQTRRFAQEHPFGPLTEMPARTWAGVFGGDEEESSDLDSGCFGVDEVPFYEVIEIELEDG